ncbi:hypothetical protein NPIL_605021 [Nephila pilipes]|uniref:Uncharacterized protein n=1 Tax=Nephila pilipes TaxID=299642 RepID=A0A8X6UEW3_NEPPI|nr:hypothetical protein NPIL_605021 [Nephila pilipes]
MKHSCISFFESLIKNCTNLTTFISDISKEHNTYAYATDPAHKISVPSPCLFSLSSTFSSFDAFYCSLRFDHSDRSQS